jgi:uncharacterized protein YcbK (DUF882 family)/general stress protein YciG
LQVASDGYRGMARRRAGCAVIGIAVAALTSLAGIRGTQDAVANGDTRTLSFLHTHTNETATVTFRRNGRYDADALNQLNWLLRDWRVDQSTKMDPRLFDIVWEVYREVGSREPVNILSAYRSPETNAMLRRRSRGVSEHSQHMGGKAMDFRLPDVDMGRVRAVAMRLQYGGVGYYPSSNFVHVDAGSVRAWPRMTQDQLARLFPDGKTVHLPATGKPLARYEEARAEILARGGAVAGYATSDDSEPTGPRRSLWASLFGGRDDEDSEYYSAQGRRGGSTRSASAYAPAAREDDGSVLAALRPTPRASERTQVAAASDGGSSGFRFPWQRAPAERPQPAQLEEPLQTAALPTPPLPPRRPDEMVMGALAVPVPPARPVELALAGVLALAGTTPPRARLADDDRLALRALFAAAATPTGPPSPPVKPPVVETARAKPQPILTGNLVADLGPALDLGFSKTPTGDLSATAFTGPAVKPLPVLR